MKIIIANSLLALITINGYAMECPQEKENLNNRYNKSLATSPAVVQCFTAEHADVITIRTKKRLFFHLFVQAAQDKNFTAASFADLAHDINRQEDSFNGPLIKTNYSAAFHTLLKYIPWNGNVDQECGMVFHEVLLNNQFANAGIQAHQGKRVGAPLKITIVANNEDDFDSEMDHREKIEKEFSKLLGK